MTDILTGVIDGADPGRTGEGLSLGRPAAGKTGTTNDNAAVWFVGYTPELSTAVWVGDPRGGKNYPMANVTINGRYYREIFGATLPGPIWKLTMLGALEGVSGTAFPGLDPRSVAGLPVEVPRLFGKTAAEAQALLAEVGLVAAINPEQVRSTAAKDTVAYTRPGNGANVESGSTVEIRISNGVPPRRLRPRPRSCRPRSTRTCRLEWCCRRWRRSRRRRPDPARELSRRVGPAPTRRRPSRRRGRRPAVGRAS